MRGADCRRTTGAPDETGALPRQPPRSVASAGRTVTGDPNRPPEEISGYGALLGHSQPMRELFCQLRRLEASSIPILINGPSGCGKEVAARELHRRSPFGDGPFIPVNCGSLDRALARSELFGHRRGAFTGAIQEGCRSQIPVRQPRVVAEVLRRECAQVWAGRRA